MSGFVAHENRAEVEARQRMRSRHYLAYLRAGDMWYEVDDAKVTALATPPDHFPYIVS